jgi:hypothetical protein
MSGDQQPLPRTRRGVRSAPSTTKSVPLITVFDCTLSIRRSWLEIKVLIAVFAVLASASFIMPYLFGLNSDPLVGRLATGALLSPSLFPLKPAFDRFSKIQFLKQVSLTLQKGEPLSETIQTELRSFNTKRGILR